MKEKVLFFDIDGTLVCSQMGIYEIPLGVKQQLNRLKKQGHKLFICSGINWARLRAIPVRTAIRCSAT